MSHAPPPDSVPSDPLINASYTPSRSRHRPVLADEQSPLLGAGKPSKKPFYRARPLWLVPFAIVAALVRGMTLAPRVEVFTQLSCNAYHHSYNHTNVGMTTYTPHNPYTSLYYSLDPLGPPLHPNTSYTLSTQVSILDDQEEDPRRLPSSQCLSNPAVQAGAARLQTIMTTTMGLLSALTTGWWGHFGERHGRTTVLAIATLGLFLTDLTFILVSTPGFPLAAHSHKLLILAPMIEGSLGGWSSLQSATSAYISDCTSSGSRAHIFSRFTGVLFLGFSVGPIIGGYFIRNPIVGKALTAAGGKSVTSVFWVAIFCSFVNLVLVALLIPESLSKEKQARAQLEHSGKGKGKFRAVSDASGSEAGDDISESGNEEAKGGIIRAFLQPLKVFLPAMVTAENGKQRKDWSLTVLAGSLFAYMLSTGIYQLKYLYAEHVYGWGAEQLSYYISFLGGARAIHLLFILPFIIATFKPKPAPVKSPKGKAVAKSQVKTSITPSLPPIPRPASKLAAAKPVKPRPTLAHLAQEIRFDLLLTRFSLLIDIASHSLVLLSPLPSYTVHAAGRHGTSVVQSETLFVLASALASVGSGALPAIQSLALCILQTRALVANPDAGAPGGADLDVGVGRLFGALAVLQATGQMILGPMLFGLVYSGTVATYPKAVFATAAGIIVAALALLFLVRVPGGAGASSGKTKKRASREAEEVERGRSRVSKRLGHGQYGSMGGAGPSSASS